MADDGKLVGLNDEDMEMSLGTMEEMAKRYETRFVCTSRGSMGIAVELTLIVSSTVCSYNFSPSEKFLSLAFLMCGYHTYTVAVQVCISYLAALARRFYWFESLFTKVDAWLK